MVGGPARILLGTAVAGPLAGRATGRRVGVLVVPQSRAELEAVTALVATGAVTPRIDHVYPLREAPAAFARLAAGDSRGKLVVDVSEG
jgi:NADPH:quinone reductase-like Zn-dependent oxidoreductase